MAKHSYSPITQIYSSYLNIASFLGFYLFSVKDNDVNPHFRNVGVGPVIFRLRDNPWKCFKFLMRLVMPVLFVTHYILTAFSICLAIILHKRGIIITQASTGWLLGAFCSITFFLSSVKLKPKVEEFLVALRKLENQIITVHCELFPDHSRVSGIRTEGHLAKFVVCYETASIFAAGIFLTFNHNIDPKIPAYLYSLAGEQDIPWLEHLSLGMQMIFLVSNCIFRLVFQLYKLYVTGIFKVCTEIISSPLYNPKVSSGIQKNSLLAKALTESKLQSCFFQSVANYMRLRNLLHKFNQIFSWYFLLYKGLALVLTTSLLYHSVQEDGQYAKGRTGAWIFYSTISFLIIRLFVLLYSMGQLHAATKEFSQKWRILLAWNHLLTPRNKALLQCTTPFGFVAGEFYTITSSTLLTFYSILLSYIILAFQL